MDCEKFESILLDELYDELDEVTSAAAKRHVGGCARCASLFSGLKATRRVAVLPIVEPPADLEDRIMTAAREAQRVVPIGGRASRAISWAGSWAMRPQTAMAALFLLMIGSSALLLRGKQAASPRSAVTVSEQGEPVASAITGTIERPAAEASKGAPPTPAFAAPPPPPAATASAYAFNDNGGDSPKLANEPKAEADGYAARRASAPPAGRVNLASKAAPDSKSLASLDTDDSSPTAGGYPAQAPQHYAYAPGAGGAGGVAAAAAPVAHATQGAPVLAAPAPASPSPSGGSGSAAAAYNAGDYATATTLFDAQAANGDLPSALWAARSVRKGSGCGAAVSRFDQVARNAAGTGPGYDATFEGAQCYRQLGQLDAAQTRFRSLITVPAYVDRAKNELAQIGPNKAAKAQAPQGKGAWSQPVAAPQPAPAQTQPAPTEMR